MNTLKNGYNPIDYWNNRKFVNSKNKNEWEPFRLKQHINFLVENLKGCKRILDFGAGHGGYFNFYDEIGIRKVVSYDITANWLSHILYEGLKYKFTHFHIVKEQEIPNFHPFKNFDAAICSNSLMFSKNEHIEKVIKEIMKVSKKIIGIEYYNSFDTDNYFSHDYKKICKKNNWKFKLNKIIKTNNQGFFTIEHGSI